MTVIFSCALQVSIESPNDACMYFQDVDTMDAFSLDIESGLKSAAELSPTKKHLVRLIEFALALRDQMDSINEQSFNTFLLQIGK